MQKNQKPPAAGSDLVPALAGAMLMLAGSVAYSHEASPWGRERGKELIEAMIALARHHGFAQSGELHELLASGGAAEDIRSLADVAFNNVPLSRLLVVIRRARLHIERPESPANGSANF